MDSAIWTRINSDRSQVVIGAIGMARVESTHPVFTYEVFREEAEQLVQMSNEMADGWTLRFWNEDYDDDVQVSRPRRKWRRETSRYTKGKKQAIEKKKKEYIRQPEGSAASNTSLLPHFISAVFPSSLSFLQDRPQILVWNRTSIVAFDCF